MLFAPSRRRFYLQYKCRSLPSHTGKTGFWRIMTLAWARVEYWIALSRGGGRRTAPSHREIKGGSFFDRAFGPHLTTVALDDATNRG
jgi:hypothetical protein